MRQLRTPSHRLLSAFAHRQGYFAGHLHLLPISDAYIVHTTLHALSFTYLARPAIVSITANASHGQSHRRPFIGMIPASTYPAPQDSEKLALLHSFDYDVEYGAGSGKERYAHDGELHADEKDASSSSDQLADSRRTWITAGLCFLAVLAYLVIFGYLVLLGIRNQERLLHDEEAEIMGLDSGDWLE